MRLTNFINEGSFYKGNLHCHSTRSDGRLSTDKLVDIYREKGYHFLAITDHNIFSNFTEYNSNDFITIRGVEGNPLMAEGDNRRFHFVAFHSASAEAKDSMKRFEHDERIYQPLCSTIDDIQKYINFLHDRGLQIMIAHPYWSRIEYDDILPLKHIQYMEIYNHCSGILENVGESNVCYDAVIRNGMKLWACAVDDNHNAYSLDSNDVDSFGGFIVVKSMNLDETEICKAIEMGSFYSSQGPEIFEFSIENNVAKIECSPCERIYINGDCRQNKFRSSYGSKLITSFETELFGDEKYVRMECYDSNGRKAYTNPIWLS